jgi:hypothetical protein
MSDFENLRKVLMTIVDDVKAKLTGIETLLKENAKLNRLLAEACTKLDEWCVKRGSDELEQWWDEHKEITLDSDHNKDRI